MRWYVNSSATMPLTLRLFFGEMEVPHLRLLIDTYMDTIDPALQPVSMRGSPRSPGAKQQSSLHVIKTMLVYTAGVRGRASWGEPRGISERRCGNPPQSVTRAS